MGGLIPRYSVASSHAFIGSVSLVSLPSAVSISHIPLMSMPSIEMACGSAISTTQSTLVVPSQWSSGSLLQTSCQPSLLGSSLPGSLPPVPSQSNPLLPGPTSPAHTSSGFTLAPALGIIPQKLVEKVRSGAYVEMREFLRDNILLLEQLETLQGSMPQLASIPGAARPRLREVTTPLSWIYCFLNYMGVSTSDPTTRKQAAYAGLILMEAQRHGGRGWLEYDKAFRRQAANNPLLQWDIINQGIQASTIINQGLYCTICNQTDHLAQQCALSFFQPPLSSQGPLPNGLVATTGHGRQKPRSTNQSLYHREFALNICISWNKGRCAFPSNCMYRHICASCQAKHKARDCPVTSASIYKQSATNSGSQVTPRST